MMKVYGDDPFEDDDDPLCRVCGREVVPWFGGTCELCMEEYQEREDSLHVPKGWEPDEDDNWDEEAA